MAAGEREFIRLKSGDESFQRRSDFVFAGLGSLEPSGEVLENVTLARREQRMVHSGRNATRLPSKVPRHVLCPEKWTKYSLEFDGSEAFRGVNEHDLNKHAAHSFLETLRKRKAEKIEPTQQRTEELSKNKTKISFRKPFVSKDKHSSHKSGKGEWKNGTYVMPEYLAGVSSRSRAKARKVGSTKDSGVSSSASGAKVCLGHLREDSGDETMAESVREPCVKQRKGRRAFKKREVDDDEGDVKKLDDEEEAEKIDDGRG